MSQEVDSRVVEMRFDNANFEKNTKQTISTIDRLMEKLQFKGAEKGFEKLDAAAKDVDFATMQTSLDRLESKFSSLNIVATTALVNITNKFVDAGEKLVKSLSIDQVASGWDKYTEKTSNVQTIMNATGKSIDQVNGYLNKLMWYSDETSYSFSEMTSALSQMTAAGGNIDKMIPMIMGIANATADAGKTGFAFQSTIRNLTQSYSAGHLQLQDWKSLNLMGTATKALKQELIDTAVELGTLKKGEVTIGTFESSLSKKWANTKVMEKTFEKYASMMEAAYEMTQKNKGMTSSEALEKLSGQYGELAERAALAAQQATSFGQAIDSTKDAVSSKWMAVFETFFGNKEEATETWTELSDRLYDIFVPSIDGLNERLKDGLNSGWAQLQGRLGGQSEVYASVLEKVAVASGAVTQESIEAEGSFAKALKKGTVNAELLQNGLTTTISTLKGYLALSDKELNARNLDKEAIEKDYEALVKLNEEFRNTPQSLASYAEKIMDTSGREHLVQSLWNIMDAVGAVMTPIREAFGEIFPALTGGQIHSFAEALDALTGKLIISADTAEKIKKVFKGFFSVIKVGTTAIFTGVKTVTKALGSLWEVMTPLRKALLDTAGGLGDFLTNLQEVLTGSKSTPEKIKAIGTAVKTLVSPLGNVFELLKTGNLKQVLEDLIKSGNKNVAWLENLSEEAQKVLRPLLTVFEQAAHGGLTFLGVVGTVAGGVINELGKAADFVAQWASGQLANAGDLELTLTNLPKKIGEAVTAFSETFKKSLSTMETSASDLFQPVTQFFTALKEGFDSISGLDVYRFLSLIDVGLLAFTIGQLAKATKSFSTIVNNLFQGPVTQALKAMAGSFNALSGALKSWTKNNNSKVMLTVAESMLLFAASMAIVSNLVDPDRLDKIAGTMLGFGVLLLAAVKILEPTTVRFGKVMDNLKAQALNAASMWGLAAALIGLAFAAKEILTGTTALLAVMKDGDMADSVAGLVMVITTLGAALGAFYASIKAIVVDGKSIKGKTLVSLGAALVSFGISLKLMANAVGTIAGIDDWGKVTIATTSILFMVGALGTLAVAMKKWGSFDFQNGAGFAALGLGVIELAAACKIISDIDTDKLYDTFGVVAILMGEMGVIGAAAKMGLRTGASMILMATALNAMAAGMWMLSKAVNNMGGIGDALGVLLSLELMLFGGGGLLNWKWGGSGTDAAKSMFIMATSLTVLAGAIALYDKLGVENTVASLLVLFDAMVTMAGGLYVLNRWAPNAEGAANALMTVSKAILAMAGAVALFNFATPESMIAALNAIMIAFVGLLAGGALIEKFPLLGKAMDVLAASFEKFGSAMQKLAIGTAVLGVLSLFAGPLCTAIINAAPDIGDALTAIIQMICQVLMNCAVPIAEALTYTGAVVVSTIALMLGLIDNETYNSLTGSWDSLTEWFSEHSLGDLIVGWFTDAADKVKNFFDLSGLFSLDDPISAAAGNWGAAFGHALNEASSLTGTDLGKKILTAWFGDGVEFKEKGEESGAYVAQGSAKGMEDNLDQVENASHALSNTIVETANGDLQIESPSRVMAETGRYVVLGLAEGLQDQSAISVATNAMTSLCSRIENEFRNFWSIHSPSEHMEELAEYIPEGAANGIEQGTANVTDAVDQQNAEVERHYSEYRQNLIQRNRDAVSDVQNVLETGFGDIGSMAKTKGTEALQNFANGMADGMNQMFGGSKWLNSDVANNLLGGDMGWFEQMYTKTKDDASNVVSTATKSKASKTGKSLADTLASAFSDQLKANKTEMSNATGEYALWEVTGGDTATVEELITKKTESLTREIELQTKRVAIAKDQYDTLLAKVGANNSKTKDAYGTLLSEQKTLAELQRSKQDSILKVIQERYETDAKTAEDEYELWSALYEDSAEVTEKSNKKIDYINRKIKNQAEILLATEKDYIAIKNEFGEASQKTQAAYQQYLEAQTEQQKLINELNQAQLDAYDSKVSYLEKQEKLVTNRQNMLAKLYGDGDLAGREDAYKAAVEQYGADSVQARKAATQGTMTAIIGVGTALDSMSYSLKKVTNKQLKYDEAVKKFGKNSETALDALADLQSEQYNFVGFAENLADAFELDDSGKRMMMQLGYSISKNWRPIQEGFNSVWAQVQKSAPEMAAKLSRAFGVATQDGVTNVITDLIGTITALVSGDWGGAVTGGITTVLDFMGSEFGQTMMNLGKTMLTFNKLTQGGGTLKIMGQVVKVTGVTENLGSILGNMSGLLGSATGGTGLLGQALGGLGNIGEMITGSGGLLGGLGELGSTLMSVLGSIGPEGWLIGAAVVGGGLLIANWDKVSEFFSGFFDWLGNAFSNLWDWISNGFQGLVDVGKNLISGLWEGITGAAGAVWNGICDFGSSIVNGFCDFFGIHSPSRVMAGIGEYLSLGLAQGITDETGSVVQGVQDVSDTALSTMMDLAQRVGDIASDDFEYEPSIQPVVDMSDVQNGVDWLNDTLFQNGTVALNAERTAGLAANVVRRAEVTKAQQEEANKADQKANPNADIVSSVEALGEHIDSIARAVANMKVQMNSRKLVGEIINDVDEGLGKINRRNNR